MLGLNEDTRHLIVCNGYKDEEYMRLALMGQKLGHTVMIVLEQLNELDVLLKVADEMGVAADGRRPHQAGHRRARAAGPRAAASARSSGSRRWS